MKQFRKNTGGFTLVEIIVTLMIVSIVIVLSGSMLFSSSNMFQHTAKSNRAKLFGDEVFKLITDDLKFATNIQITEDDGSGSVADGGYKYQNVYRFNLGDEKNKVFRSTDFGKAGTYNNIYGDGMYGELQLRITVKPQYKERRQGVLSFTVDVLNKDGDVSYTTGSDILVNTMYARGSFFEYPDDSAKGNDDTFVNPVISYVQRSMDPLEATATEIRGYYIGTYEMLHGVYEKYNKLNPEVAKEHTDWFQHSDQDEKSSNFSNSPIRSYVNNKYYKGSWPKFEGFPDYMLESLPGDAKIRIEKFLSGTNGLYYQPFAEDVKVSKGKDFAEKNCFIFLGLSSSGDNWNAYFVYDHENNIWYASGKIHQYNHSMDPQGISKKGSWEQLKQELSDKNLWLPLNQYPQN